MGSGQYGVDLRCLLRILLGPLRMDRHRRDLAYQSKTIWYCTRSLIELDEQLHCRSGYSRYADPYDLWYILVLWDSDVHGCGVHLEVLP